MINFKWFIPVVLICSFFILLLIFRSDLIDIISRYQQNLLPANEIETLETRLNQVYDYENNGKSFSYTLIEFGSTKCAACKNMELVLEKIRTHFPDKVQVVFINVTDKSNKELVTYFGISIIPAQVILNRKGNEVFRHTGYISETELEKQFK
ncbi:MAG: thioredoxin family protein [Bacteroidales bacterium]|jgi:thioredoxin 1|nr:thioredoxin family protein [Bacteroidales bacterium]